MRSGAARGLAIKDALQGMTDTRKEPVELALLGTDSAAAAGVIHRHGAGRVRQSQTRRSWHRGWVRAGGWRRR
eukprot:5038844-Pyramimonas_sp.AAC.1